jgi:LuxR family maltose regulon positive regulatory protein
VIPYLTPEHDKEPFLFNPPSNLYPPTRFIQGLVEESAGNLDDASAAFEDAITSAREKQNHHVVALALGHLGDMQTRQAHLRQAQKTFYQVIQSGQENPSFSTNFVALSHLGLGNLVYEWNQLSEALHEYQVALELARVWNFRETLIPGHLLVARVYAAQGDFPAAYAALEKLDQIPDEEAGVANLAAGLYRAYLDSETGNQASAEAWLAQNGTDAGQGILFMPSKGYLVLAHLLINLHRTIQARQILDNLQVSAETGHRWGDVIEISVLQALALQADALEDAAVKALTRAMELAEGEGYLRTFLDAGEALRRLIKARQSHLPKEYAARLLSAFAGVEAAPPLRSFPSPTRGEMIEPLSPRELEVLQLVVSGASNAQIASRLVLSLNTVKKHVSNIFGKLGVTTRLQAVEQVRKSGLLKE